MIQSPSRKTRFVGLALCSGVVAVGACQEKTPTGPLDPGTATPITVQVELDWSDFGSNLVVLGGYGTTGEVARGVMADSYAGSLTARTLARFSEYPVVATITDTTGTARPDSSLTFIAGRVVAHFDTVASTNAGPVTVQVGALASEWHVFSTTWTQLRDTIGDSQPWPQPGAGPVTSFGTATFDPTVADSVLIELDSAEVAFWGDSLQSLYGARLDAVTTGERLHLRAARMILDTRPSVNPDTIVQLDVPARALTFVYDPLPTPPTDGLRVGGVPAWRSALDVTIPAQLNAPLPFCQAVGCPHTIEPEQVSYAALILTSRAPDLAFAPSDSVAIDARALLDRASLPKAPLGPSLIESLTISLIPPDLFGASTETDIEIPITDFVKDLVAGEGSPPNSLALLSLLEPLTLYYAEFHGPGSAFEPRLKLILTVGPQVDLP